MFSTKAISTKGFDKKAILLENMLFLNIYRNNKEIYFYKDEQGECDFILHNQDQHKETWHKEDIQISAIQVSYSIEDEYTKKREISGLIRACKTYSLHEGTIIIYDGHKMEEEISGIKIHIIPVIEYLLT